MWREKPLGQGVGLYSPGSQALPLTLSMCLSFPTCNVGSAVVALTSGVVGVSGELPAWPNVYCPVPGLEVPANLSYSSPSSSQSVCMVGCIPSRDDEQESQVAPLGCGTEQLQGGSEVP